MVVQFLVPARDSTDVAGKLDELQQLSYPYLIVCGEPVEADGVVYRPAIGKYDAINYGLTRLRPDCDIIALNDVDAKVNDFRSILNEFDETRADLLFVGVSTQGPQSHFYPLLDQLRTILPVAASGELMLVRRELMDQLVPIPPSKAEDSYLLLKALSLGARVSFLKSRRVITKRTETLEQERLYKRRTVSGIYRALSQVRAPPGVRLFYMTLPFLAPLLLLYGRRGLAWSRGIIEGFVEYVQGNEDGYF
jgi:hypothetical protein